MAKQECTSMNIAMNSYIRSWCSWSVSSFWWYIRSEVPWNLLKWHLPYAQCPTAETCRQILFYSVCGLILALYLYLKKKIFCNLNFGGSCHKKKHDLLKISCIDFDKILFKCRLYEPEQYLLYFQKFWIVSDW